MARTKVVVSLFAPNQCKVSATSSNGLTAKNPLEEEGVVEEEEEVVQEAVALAREAPLAVNPKEIEIEF